MRLLYLSLLSFVFIATSSLAITDRSDSRQVKSSKGETKTLASLPILKKDVSFPIISAQSALAVDLDSQISLYEKNPDSPFYPASTTKIVTALVAMGYYPQDLVLTVGDIKVEGQRMGLVRGEKITVGDLLYGLLIFSANDAAEVLAQNYCVSNEASGRASPKAMPAAREVGSCGRDAFIAAMNLKAKEINLKDSTFANPTGLDGVDHVTTARDLIRMSAVAMQSKLFSEIVGQRQKEAKSIDGKIIHKLVNTNELIGSVDGVLGVKTGWTESARENLVTYLKRDGKMIMIALLGSQDRFGETKELIKWILENYEWREISFPD